jgi:hypothetical protein
MVFFIYKGNNKMKNYNNFPSKALKKLKEKEEKFIEIYGKD